MLNSQENSHLGSGLLHYIFTQTKLPSVTLAHSEHMATSPDWSNITNWKYQSVYFCGCQIVSDCHLLCLKFRANGASSTSVFLFFVGSPLISPLAAEDGREVEGRPLFLPWVLILENKTTYFVLHLRTYLRCDRISIVNCKRCRRSSRATHG